MLSCIDRFLSNKVLVSLNQIRCIIVSVSLTSKTCRQVSGVCSPSCSDCIVIELFVVSERFSTRPVFGISCSISTIKVNEHLSICITLEHASECSERCSVAVGVRYTQFVNMTFKCICSVPVSTNIDWFCCICGSVGSTTSLYTVNIEFDTVSACRRAYNCDMMPSISTQVQKTRGDNISSTNREANLSIFQVKCCSSISVRSTSLVKNIRSSCDSICCRTYMNIICKCTCTECKLRRRCNTQIITSTVQEQRSSTKLLLCSIQLSITIESDIKDIFTCRLTSTNLTNEYCTTCLIISNNLTLSISGSDCLTDCQESRTLLVIESNLSDDHIFSILECISQIAIFNLIVSNLLIILECSSNIVMRNDIVINKLSSRELSGKLTRVIRKVYNINLRFRNIIQNDIGICGRGQAVKQQTKERRTFGNINLLNKLISYRILIRRCSSNSCNNIGFSTNNNIIQLNIKETRFRLICTNGLTESEFVSDF